MFQCLAGMCHHLIISCVIVTLRGRTEVKIHKVKINQLPIDFEKAGKCAQLAETEPFIQRNGTFVVIAHFKINLFYPGFPRKGKHALCQNVSRTAAPPCFFQTDTEFRAVAHTLGLAIEAGGADDLPVYLGKQLDMIVRLRLHIEMILESKAPIGCNCQNCLNV